MEEKRQEKLKRGFKTVYKIVSYTFIIILIIIAAFFVFYAISSKLAEKQNKKAQISLYTIISPSMTPSIKVYDVIMVKNVDTNSLKPGDVITFYSTNAFFGGTPITHRIVEVLDVPETGIMYRVKGDANEDADEEKVLPSNIIGKVLFRVPQLGKIQFFLASKTGWLVAILIPSILIFIYDIKKLIRLITLKNDFAELGPDKI